jgi:hypothetical protein
MIEKAYGKSAGRCRSQEDIEQQAAIEERLRLQEAQTCAELNIGEPRPGAPVYQNDNGKDARGLRVLPTPRRIYEAGKTYRAWSVR